MTFCEINLTLFLALRFTIAALAGPEAGLSVWVFLRAVKPGSQSLTHISEAFWIFAQFRDKLNIIRRLHHRSCGFRPPGRPGRLAAGGNPNAVRAVFHPRARPLPVPVCARARPFHVPGHYQPLPVPVQMHDDVQTSRLLVPGDICPARARPAVPLPAARACPPIALLDQVASIHLSALLAQVDK